MSKYDFKAKTKRKYKATTDSDHKLPVAPNLLLERDIEADTLDQIWISDITYIWTREGWLYLAVILDMFSRKAVGWSVSHRLTRDLVITALKQAIWRRRPSSGLIFHSDRRSQYASNDFKELLNTHNMIQSMSRKVTLMIMLSWNLSFIL
jgi:transposase InsO family protein